MASGWHQLPRRATGDDLDDEEEEEEEKIEEEEERVDAKDQPENGEEETRPDAELRIDIRDRIDSFWDDDDDHSPVALQPPPFEDDLSIINVLAQQLRQQAIPSYLEHFEIVVPEAELVIGAVPLEDLQQREHAIEDAKIRAQQLELERFRLQETRLAQRHALAREALQREAARKHQQLVQQKRQLAQTALLQSQRLGYVFHQAEAHLKATLQRQQARVAEVFGRLDASHGPVERRRYRVAWDHIPVTLKIRVKMFRALKDKLPRGQYALLATLYDRLGGHALHWTAWDPEEKKKKHENPWRSSRVPPSPTRSDSLEDPEHLDRPNVTRPFRHRGRFFSTDVAISDDVFVVCPPQAQLRPGNVLVFELFLLETSTVRARRSGPQLHDQIVAWGAMPLMTPEFTYVDGKFKLPFLKGEMDATMDKYRDMEDMYTRDLSAWLCNLYVHITPLKDEMARLMGDRFQGDATRYNYDVEIDQRTAEYRLATGSSSETEHLRIRRKTHVVSPEATFHGSDDPAPNSVSVSATLLLEDSDADLQKGTPRKRGFLGLWTAASTRAKKRSNRVYAGSTVMPQLDETNADDPSDPKNSHDTKRMPLPIASDGHVFTPSALRQHSRLAPIPQYEEEEEEDDGDAVLDTENYRFSVNSAVTRESAHHVRFHAMRKLQYLRHELFADLGLTRRAVQTMDFWLLLLLLLLALWLRVYIHYLSQWLFLKAQRVAVFFFRPQWTTCLLKYTWRSVATHTEIGVVIAGVVGNGVFFASLAVTAAVTQAHVGELPAFGSKFLVCVGVATLLDPLLVLLVDIVYHQYDCASHSECLTSLSSPNCLCVDGDAFKLYTRFLAHEGSGLVGVAITAILYAALTSLSLVAFYMYLLHVHMNGRMLDVYRRIHAHDAELFLPHDCELPLHELHAICDQATRWKGPRGTQRKVFVHDYVLDDPLDSTFQEKSTHIALYTVGLDGDAGPRELYRHFLKSPDGAIIELFGQIHTRQENGGNRKGEREEGGEGGGSWQRDAAPGVVTSMALLHNILQDHQRTTPLLPESLETSDSDVARLLNGRQ